MCGPLLFDNRGAIVKKNFEKCFCMQSLPTVNCSLVWPNFCTPYYTYNYIIHLPNTCKQLNCERCKIFIFGRDRYLAFILPSQSPLRSFYVTIKDLILTKISRAFSDRFLCTVIIVSLSSLELLQLLKLTNIKVIMVVELL